jgi:transposase
VFGTQLLELQQQLFEQWHRYNGASIDWVGLPQHCQLIRLALVASLQQVLELNAQPGRRTPWASTVRTFRKLLKVMNALWTCLEIEGIDPCSATIKLADVKGGG